MDERLEIEEIFQVDGYGLMIYFSDKTFARYTVDELSRLRPSRETTKKSPKLPNESGV